MNFTLMERLVPELAEEHSVAGNAPPASVLADSVRRNIERLLNTREGSAGACPDYGLPDISRGLNPKVAQRTELADLIGRRIKAYEPRLQDVRVTFIRPEETADRSPFVAHFRIVGRLSEGTRRGVVSRGPVTFATRHDEEGIVVVSRSG